MQTCLPDMGPLMHRILAGEGLTHDHDCTGDAVQQQEGSAGPDAQRLVPSFAVKQGGEEVEEGGDHKGCHQEQQDQVYHNKTWPALASSNVSQISQPSTGVHILCAAQGKQRKLRS